MRTLEQSKSIRAVLACGLLACLSACGGGGGGDNGGAQPPVDDTKAAPTAQACAPTNPYRADATATTTTGTLGNEKAWLRAYMSGAYLWYSEMTVPDVNAAAFTDTSHVYTSLDNYFEALKTPQLTSSGKRRDQFSFTYPTKAWNQLMQSGVSAGYGMQWYMVQPYPPRGLRLAYVDPGSPAAQAGLRRGDTLVSVDGVGADDSTQNGVNVLNAALFPSSLGAVHRFIFSRGGVTLAEVSLTTAEVVSTPVPTVAVLNDNGRKVGYILFNDHMASAEGALISAINTLKAAAVQDLVLDLRYNGGGYLYIASGLAYMIAGAERTQGKVFEQLQYNDKRTSDTNSADARTPFYDTSCLPDANGNCTSSNALPTLGLSRVAVITSGSTCSASEAIVNGLRGVDVDVRLIGATTCGKPYGFTAKDNCGISYFPIEFKGVNAKGFGDYADGFTATCTLSDDMDHALGDVGERRLAGALQNLRDGTCPAVAGADRSVQSVKAAASAESGRLLRGPERESRVLRPLHR